MAYRRSIIARTKLFYQQQQRFAPSFSHISSRDREEQPPKSICRNSQFLISRNYGSNPLLSGNVTRLMRSEVPMARYGLNFSRNYSNVPLDGVIGVKAAPVVNEVAVAAADSFAPVAAFQHLIDYVHCYTGLEWWASIAATTLLIRFIHLPTFIFMPKFAAVRLLYPPFPMHICLFNTPSVSLIMSCFPFSQKVTHKKYVGHATSHSLTLLSNPRPHK